MQLARQVAGGEERFDEILCPVGRAGIADDPAVDVARNCAETALEICHLVLDDHVQANASVFYHRRTFLVAASNYEKLKLDEIDLLDAQCGADLWFHQRTSLKVLTT